MIRADVIWDMGQLGALHEEWERLYAVGHSEPSTSLEWTNALLESHVRATDTVFAVVLREADRIVSIVPAIVRREKVIGPFNVAILSFLSELHNTHSDILRASDRPDAIAALFSALVSVPCRWDVFAVRRLLESNHLTRHMTDFVSQSAYPCRIRREQPSFVLDLGQGYDQFLRSRSGKFRNYLKRKTRQLNSLGRVKMLRAGRDLGLADAYADRARKVVSFWTMGFNQHTRGTWVNEQAYMAHLLTGKFATPGNSAFSLTGQPSACGTAREVGTFSHRLPADMVVDNPAHRARAEEVWRLPSGTINPQPGSDITRMMRDLEDGTLKWLWVQVNNPFQAAANASHWIAAARKNVQGRGSHPAVSDDLREVGRVREQRAPHADVAPAGARSG